MRVSSIVSTDLFVGTKLAPCQVVRVDLQLEPGESSRRVTLAGNGVQTVEPGIATDPAVRKRTNAVTRYWTPITLWSVVNRK